MGNNQSYSTGNEYFEARNIIKNSREKHLESLLTSQEDAEGCDEENPQSDAVEISTRYSKVFENVTSRICAFFNQRGDRSDNESGVSESCIVSVKDTQDTNTIENEKANSNCNSKLLSRVESEQEVLPATYCPIEESNSSEPNTHRLVQNQLKYHFPFENLVLAGGGAKGPAYCGVCRAFEEWGIMPQIKRFAGTSAGSIAALLFAIGCNSYDVEKILSVNMKKVVEDSSGGYFSFLPNLFSNFGWHPGNRVLDYLGDILVAKGYQQDTTFQELYDRDSIELCVVVANVNTMREEYCHIKTTPDMPVRLAVRMSMSIPGLFQAIKHKMYSDTNYYADGALICNYPIHCFDGWWLSMAEKDNFLYKIDELKDIDYSKDHKKRFEYVEGNYKTLGCLVYSETEQVYNKTRIEKTSGITPRQLPKTQLAKDYEKYLRKKKKLDACSSLTEDAMILCELKIKLTDDTRNLLFGDACDYNKAFAAIDRNGDGKITIMELMQFIGEIGLPLHEKYLGIVRKDVGSFWDFVLRMFMGLSSNVNATYLKGTDADRSIGVNTRYAKTLDFNLEDDDKKFLIEQGRMCTEQYLRNFMAQHRQDEIKTEHNSLKEKMGNNTTNRTSINQEKLTLLLKRYK